MGFCLKDVYSDFDNPSEVEGGSVIDRVTYINDAIQAGMSCFRICGGGSFPYLPGGEGVLCGGTGQESLMTFPLTTQTITQRDKNSPMANCGQSEGADSKLVTGRILHSVGTEGLQLLEGSFSDFL